MSASGLAPRAEARRLQRALVAAAAAVSGVRVGFISRLGPALPRQSVLVDQPEPLLKMGRTEEIRRSHRLRRMAAVAARALLHQRGALVGLAVAAELCHLPVARAVQVLQVLLEPAVVEAEQADQNLG